MPLIWSCALRLLRLGTSSTLSSTSQPTLVAPLRYRTECQLAGPHSQAKHWQLWTPWWHWMTGGSGSCLSCPCIIVGLLRVVGDESLGCPKRCFALHQDLFPLFLLFGNDCVNLSQCSHGWVGDDESVRYSAIMGNLLDGIGRAIDNGDGGEGIVGLASREGHEACCKECLWGCHHLQDHLAVSLVVYQLWFQFWVFIESSL